jgi:copper chaperone CopZ
MSVDPKAEVHIDLAAKRVEADTDADRKDVTQAIIAAGYTVVAA